MRNTITSTRGSALVLAALAALSVAAGCSPGTLPGSPSPVVAGGGGARYNGSITVRRIGGNYVLNEASQLFVLSLVTGNTDQITGRFESGSNTGTISGTLSGNLASGSIQATILVSTSAQQGGSQMTCEGRGAVSGTLAGVDFSWDATSITYDNCPGLSTSSSAQAVAVSPIPGASGNRANIVIGIVGGTSVTAGSCSSGGVGFPFTVEITETAGIGVTFDPTFTAEERRGGGVLVTSTLDMPFVELPGGGQRTYTICSRVPGTYQAFFTGLDSNGNQVRVASPVVNLGSFIAAATMEGSGFVSLVPRS